MVDSCATEQDTEFDLLVVGGGINGAGIARDAAGRGVKTALVDQGDFGGATSSASTKLIHGGLRYLEYYEFRLVKGSHIVVPRVHEGEHAYILQNVDKRVIFIIPYQDAWSLIGTTDIVIETMAQAEAIDEEETRYLLAAVNRYLAKPLGESDVVWSFTGARPLYDDGKGDPAAITRDYTLVVDDRDGAAQLALFGGKLTTYRKLAETVLDKLSPWLAYRRAPWTDGEALPGGDFDPARLDAEAERLYAAWPQLPRELLKEMFHRHGLAVAEVLGDARTLEDLGRDFGGGLYQREAEYFIAHEWALAAEDILWRRSKTGLRMSAAQREDFSIWFAASRAASE
ncbi:MAG: FAD-dependent oxidoreductase [Rhodocyclaceae bacterium]|nr:FAD-dependent oxidoreductase [Rhodocyclaceae bacterium]